MKYKSYQTKLKRHYREQVHRDIFSLAQMDIDSIALRLGPCKKGQKLIVESQYPLDPRLMLSSRDNDVYFVYGYIQASIMLLNIVHYGKSYFRKDSYIYPAMFCFRMYLELTMKLIIKNRSGIVVTGHSLMKIWDELKSVCSLQLDDDVESVEFLIKSFHELDERSTTFRYPKMLNLSQESWQQSMMIDIQKLQECFLQLYRFFDGLYLESSVNE